MVRFASRLKLWYNSARILTLLLFASTARKAPLTSNYLYRVPASVLRVDNSQGGGHIAEQRASDSAKLGSET